MRKEAVNSRRNPNEQNRTHTAGLSDLQKNEVTARRNGRGTGSAVSSRIHQKERARFGTPGIHLPRGPRRLPQGLRQRRSGRLGDFRKDYVKDVLEEEIGELSALDEEVIESLHQHEILSSDIEKQFEKKLTFGERLSDRIAEFGGSWKFLITFGAVIVVWIGANAVLLATGAFDPYPFILLNLILSCLAAVQAPIIMMSQNRAEARDRLRGENDYKINLKAELEIRHLHEKLDHLLRRQYNRLFEIQQIQIELLQEIGRHKQ